ncbi:MAG: threonine ammonia-lyase [Actinomycetota bacterium]
MTSTVTAADIGRAAAAIADDVVRTPTAPSLTLSAMTGAHIHVKFENLQFTGSFKDRGAANHLRALGAEGRARGVIALSAGNHAQGVAHHAGRLGVRATVVMPSSAPFTKVSSTRALGADVVQAGSTLADAVAELEEQQRRHGYVYVPPFDDAAVIAGQGTVALEMLADAPQLDVIIVPVGGGGLLSGMAVAAKSLRPDVEVIGVQVAAYPEAVSRFHRRPIGAEATQTLADGIAVKAPGQLTMPLIERLVDDMVVVSEEDTERAIALYAEIEKTVAEGAGAVPLAAVLADPDRFADRRVGLVLSGGNIDSRVLASVLLRGLVRTERVSVVRVRVADLPGQLAPIVDAIAERGANIIEIEHRRTFDAVSARSANIDVTMETRDVAHRDEVMAAVRALGQSVELLS